MRELHALRHDAVAALGRALDATVDDGVLVGKDEDEDLGTRVGLVAGHVPGSGNDGTSVVARSEVHGGALVLHPATVGLINLDELLDKVVDARLVRLAATLAGDDGDAPALQRRSVGKQKLLALQVPAAGSARVGNTSAVLNLGRSEDTGVDNGLVGGDLQAVLLEVGVRVPGKHPQTVLDSLPALSGRSDGELDHVRGLPLVALEWVALVLLDAEKLHGNDDRAAATLHLNHGEVGVLNANVISLQEVVVNGDGSLLASLLVALHKLVLLGRLKQDLVNHILIDDVGAAMVGDDTELAEPLQALGHP